MSFAVLGDQKKLLPAFCKPYSDELLSCWLTRMAFNHGLTTKELCAYIWPDYTGNPDIDRTISHQQVAILAAKTNCTVAEVNDTTLASYLHILFKTNNLIYGQERWLVPSKHRRTRHSSGLMYCACCLKKQPYFRKNWRLALSFACTTCGHYLQEACPHCRNGNSFIDVGECDFADQTLTEYLVNCHHCGKDVTDCEPEIAPPEMVKLQQQLYDIIDHGLNDQMVYTESYFRVLHHITKLMIAERHVELKLRRFAEHVFLINRLPFERYKCDPLEVRSLPVRQRANVLKAAYWLLQEWPHRFIEIALNHYIKRLDIFRDFPNAPFWFWEPLYYGMSPSLPIKTERLGVDNIEQCTARQKQERVPSSDYDFDMDEAFYLDEMYAENDEDYIPVGRRIDEDAEVTDEEEKEEEPVWSFDR